MSIINTYSAIIVAIIGLLGTFLPILYNSNLNGTDGKGPLIAFSKYIDRENATLLNLNVKNIGNAIATNMSLYINSPISSKSSAIISNLTNIFSPTEIKYNNKTINIGETLAINNSNLKLDVPKLIHGEGSDISLQMSLLYNHYLSRYNTNIDIIAIYDQGSSKTHLAPYLTANELFKQFWDTYFSGWLGTIYLILFLIFYIILIYYFGVKRRRKKYFEKLVNNLIAIRDTLYLDRKSNKKIDFSLGKNQLLLEKLDSKSLSKIKLRKGYERILDIEDFIHLNDLYMKIHQRNLLLQNTKTDETELEGINSKLLKKLDEILLKINWKKYL
jgi:hypothetical protein